MQDYYEYVLENCNVPGPDMDQKIDLHRLGYDKATDISATEHGILPTLSDLAQDSFMSTAASLVLSIQVNARLVDLPRAGNEFRGEMEGEVVRVRREKVVVQRKGREEREERERLWVRYEMLVATLKPVVEEEEDGLKSVEGTSLHKSVSRGKGKNGGRRRRGGSESGLGTAESRNEGCGGFQCSECSPTKSFNPSFVLPSRRTARAWHGDDMGLLMVGYSS